MGYVFDAMKRGGGTKRPRPAERPAAAPDPAVPQPIAQTEPVPAATAASTAVAAQPQQEVEGLVDTVQQQVAALGQQLEASTPTTTTVPAAQPAPQRPGAPPRSEPSTIHGAEADEPQTPECLGQRAPRAAAPAPAASAHTDTLAVQAMEQASWSAHRPADPRASAEQRVVAPSDATAVDDRLVALGKPACVMAEEYRSIRTGLLARWEQRRHLVHTITSATPQEGKTITSLNLGLIFAELHNRRTVVVEADLRLPQFSQLLGLREGPGLLGYLERQATLTQIAQVVGENGLHVIQAGGRANDRSVQLLSSREMATLLAELRRQYDHVIIDTPPVLDLADAGIIGGRSDDLLLVVRMQVTPKPVVEQAIRTLGRYKTTVAGVIATDQRHSPGRHRYKKGNGYHYRYFNSSQA